MTNRLTGFVASAGRAGHAITGIVTGAQALRTAIGAVNMARLTASLRHLVSGAGGVRGAVVALGARLRTLASNPTFQKLAAGAIAAVAAIGAVVLAVKLVRAGFATLQSIAGRAFAAVRAGAHAASSAVSGVVSGIKGMGGGLGKMAGGVGPLAAIAAGLGVAALAVSQLKSALSSAGDFEVLTVRVEQFLGSAQKAQAFLKDMADFANATPFETKDVQETGAGLLAAGVTGNVGGLVKELAAVARNGQQLGELGDALGKGFAKGKFQTEELNKFLERGINLMPELAAVTGKSGTELRKLIEDGLSFDTVTEAIRRMSGEGGQFQGMLARLSMTGAGLMSTLVSAWEEVRREFGQPILNAIKPLMQDGLKVVAAMKEKATAAGAAIGNALLTVIAAFKAGNIWNLATAGMNLAFRSGIDVLMRGLKGAVAFLATALPPIFAAAMAKLRDPKFWDGVITLLAGIGHKITALIKEAIEPLVDTTTIGGDKEREAERNYHSIVGDVDMINGKAMMAEAGGGIDFVAVLGKWLAKAGEAAEVAANEDRKDNKLAAAQADFVKLTAELAGAIAALKEKSKVPDAIGKAQGGGVLPPADGAVKKSTQVGSVVSSGARIGKGGFGMLFFSPLVAESKKHTGQLASIAKSAAILAGGKGVAAATARYS